MYAATVNGAAAPTSPQGPLDRYRDRVARGQIKLDPSQLATAKRLEALHKELIGYRPAQGAGGGGLIRLPLGRRREPPPPPRGLYIHGGVGRGKSMLMDLFFETAPVSRKRRVHFNAFMLEVHRRIHAWREATRGRKGADDPIAPLAGALADEAWLLCFDEFHVVDIADAMILGRLFTRLFELGVVVVATSNWAADDLYKDGLQRDLFLPFIALLKQRVEVLHLDAPVDYRFERLRGAPVYHCPLGPATRQRLEDQFRDLTDGHPAQPIELAVQGRTLLVPRAAHGVAWVGFDPLCTTPLGSADYLALADRFHTVILDGVPKLKAEQRNEAKRLILLVDALYEAKAMLIVAADVPPHRIYADGVHAFEFDRTVSRLMEMQAADYLALPRAAA